MINKDSIIIGITKTKTSSTGDEAYKYMYRSDNIGNRVSANENGVNKSYTVNDLNQYTANSVDTGFTPTYDADGNQIRIKTSAGIFTVEYNAENRPIQFKGSMGRIYNMSYDYMGRRFYMSSYSQGMHDGDSTELFYYNGYTLIESQQILLGPNAMRFTQSYIWDPTTGQSTRPLAMFDNNNEALSDANLSDARLRDVNFRDARFDDMLDNAQNIHYYTHDANKNVTELISQNGTISAHYEYSPFGTVTVSSGPLASMNPFRFSSEFSDHPLGLIYYNYRHYNALDGRWINRDPVAEDGGWNLYSFIVNNVINFYDYLGLASNPESGEFEDGNEITWDDFTGTPPEDSNYDAKISYSYSFHPIGYNYDCKKLDAPQKTSTGKEICFSCTVKYKDYKIKYKMDKKNSYVKNKDPALLRHEIVHYQILKSFAKTWTSKFKALEGSGSGCKENDAKIAAVKVLKNNTTEKQKEFTDAFNKEEKNYDQETNHGLNSNEQKKWEDKYL